MRLSDHYFHDSSGSFTRAVVSQQIVDELKLKFKLCCPGMAGLKQGGALTLAKVPSLFLLCTVPDHLVGSLL